MGLYNLKIIQNTINNFRRHGIYLKRIKHKTVESASAPQGHLSAHWIISSKLDTEYRAKGFSLKKHLKLCISMQNPQYFILFRNLMLA